MRSLDFFQLIDGGEIHLAQLLEVGPCAVQRLFEGRHRRVGRETCEDFGQVESRGGELFNDTFATHSRFLRFQARLFHRLARCIDARLGIQAFLVERAQRVVGFFERATLGRQFGFDFQPPREEVFQLSFEFHDRQVTIGQRRFELGAANLRLRTLVGHALETHAHGGLTGATRFDADQQIATGELRRLRTCARALHGFAAFFAFVFESRAARIELSESFQAAVEFGTCAGQRVLPEPDFASDFRGLFLEALAPQRGFLRTGALTFELTEQVGVFAMCALDTALRFVALPFRRGQVRPARGQQRFHLTGVFFAVRELDLELLDALLALEHARVRITATIDAQPVAPYPLARASDDRLIVGKLPAHLQSGRKRFGEPHVRQQPHDGRGAADHAR